MNKQPEPLRLADLIERYNSGVHSQAIVEDYCKAAAELRRLHAENKALNDALQYSMGCHREMSELAVRQRARLDELERLQTKREPLTNEQVKAGLIQSIEYTDARERCAFNIGVRFAERAHGIK